MILWTADGVQVRYDRKVGKDTALKFMTDGILLRELQEDFLLSKYSSIVIDEAHERSLNTDLLLGACSNLLQKHIDGKVVGMNICLACMLLTFQLNQAVLIYLLLTTLVSAYNCSDIH